MRKWNQMKKSVNKREYDLRSLALDTVNVGTWDWNIQSGSLIINARWAQIVGYTLEELQPISIQTWLNLTHPDDLARSNDALQRFFNGDIDHYELDARMRHKNGEWVWVLDLSNTLECDELGKPVRMIGVHFDITNQKRDEHDRLNAQYHDLIEKAPFAIFISRRNDSILKYANERANQQFGVTVDSANPLRTVDFYADPSTRDAFMSRLNQHGIIHDYELKLKLLDGTPIWALVSASFTTFDDEPSVLIMINDISQHKKAEADLSREKEKYRLLADTMADVIWVYNLDENRFTYISPSVELLRGWRVEEAMAQRMDQTMTTSSMELLNREYETCLKEYLQDPSLKKTYFHEIQQIRKDGSLVWVELSSRFRQNDLGQIEVISSGRNIEQRKHIESRLDHLNRHDANSGLFNKNAFRLFIEQPQPKDWQKGYTIAHVDMDNFGMINDTLGHVKGDQIIVEIAHKLEDHIKTYGQIYHYDGDEFVLVIRSMEDTELKTLLKGLSQIISTQVLINDQVFLLTGSIGYDRSDDEKSAETVFKNANTALFVAKKQRNTTVAYEEEMGRAQTRETLLTNDLRFAIDRNELELYFQPLYNVKTNRIEEAEALLRWNHPEMGLISPVEFIPIAEKTRLILPITDWVIYEACQKLATWDENTQGELSISINISYVTMIHRGEELFKVIHQEIMSSGVKPHRLKLEITETSLVQDAVEVIKLFIQLKELGIRLALDDFGTGYSSFGYLKALPLDIVKIDRSLIRTIETDTKSKLIVETMISILHGLNLDVVIEGVENEKQYSILKSMNADTIQGYYFSKPKPWVDFSHYVHNQASLIPLSAQQSLDRYELILHWKEEWNSGHPLIDSQHKELMLLTSKLENATEWEAQDPMSFNSHVRLLIEKVKAHFIDEEKILTDLAYPEMSAHQTEHQRLLHRAEELLSLYENKQVEVYAFVTFVVRDVIWDHILLEDVRYFPYVSPLRSQEPINFIPQQHRPAFTDAGKTYRLWYAENLSFQSILTEISTDFINVSLRDFNDKMNQTLARCGKQVNADRAYIFKYDWQNKVCDNTYEWCNTGIFPQIDQLQNVPLEAIPDWVNAHLMGEAINIPDVMKLDPASNLRQLLEPQDIQSLLTVPMMANNVCFGFIGFDSVKNKHVYSDYERAMLKEVSNVILVAFKRKATEERLIQEQEFYELTVSSLDEALIILDPDCRITTMNLVAQRMLETNLVSVRGERIEAHMRLHDYVRNEAMLIDWDKVAQISNRTELPRNVGFRKKDGTFQFLSGSIHSVFDRLGKPKGILINFRDVTLEYESEKQIEAFLNVNLDMLVVADLDGHFVKVNAKATEILGYGLDELEGKRFLDLVHPEDVEKTLKLLQDLPNGQVVFNFVNRYKTHDGRYRHLEWQAQVGYGKYIYASARDITDSVMKQAEYEYHSYHDPLTGLYNRRYVEEILKNLQLDETSLPVSILMADIDSLKTINDLHGHQAGDETIIAMAESLIKRCRPTDIVARWGGDEFIVILPKTSHETALRIAERLNGTPNEASTLKVTTSSGVATKISMLEDFPEVIRLADQRMYEAKRLVHKKKD